ncbi:hypothetical protein PG997_001783 [Apiospora hydei]|uniref:Small secreted protein n=1 Tax=Apiospora hydei TaxID=1337664 RepID=A0ABR1X7K0_9PEZI
MDFRNDSAFFLGATCLLAATCASAVQLNITAVTATNGKSALECWQLDAPFIAPKTVDISGSAIAKLGAADNVDFSIIPPNFDGGLHNAPLNQWVMITAGLTRITIPGDDSDGVYIQGRQFGLIFAADTAGLGEWRYTTYPGNTETTALVIPTQNGSIPDHQVVRSGPCQMTETLGFKALAGASS